MNSLVTKRLVDKLNLNERSSINMQEMYNVLINVRDQTMVAIEKIEPFVDKKVQEIEINPLVNDVRLKLILEGEIGKLK